MKKVILIDGNNILFQTLTYDQYHSLSNVIPGKIDEIDIK